MSKKKDLTKESASTKKEVMERVNENGKKRKQWRKKESERARLSE